MNEWIRLFLIVVISGSSGCTITVTPLPPKKASSSHTKKYLSRKVRIDPKVSPTPTPTKIPSVKEMYLEPTGKPTPMIKLPNPPPTGMSGTVYLEAVTMDTTPYKPVRESAEKEILQEFNRM